MKKTLLVPPQYLKVLSTRWLALGLSLVVSLGFLSVVYYWIKFLQNSRQQTPLHIAYMLDENWQFIYSQLLINLGEEVGEENWNKALKLAQGIEPLPPENQVKLHLLETKLKQWNQVLKYLENIPEESSFNNQGKQKQKEYEINKNFINYQLENYYSEWVELIAENSPVSKNNIMITICDFFGVCRRFQGNKEIQSPASLIKIPVAVAVMTKIKKDKIKSGDKIKVISGNYTEDASDIIVGKEYSLNYLLFRMINQSSNIATNQLIDYLGWEKINDYLQQNNYTKTHIGYKVVGETTYPINAGCCANRLTTDELTKMMIDIYTIKTTENKALIKFLAEQEDRTMGYTALEGKEIKWLGEKTGRHSNFKGTTVATKINQKKYIITVAVTQGTADETVSNIIKKIAQKIHKSGDL